MIRLVRPALGSQDIQKAVSVLESGWLKQGNIVREVEAHLARMSGVEKTLLVSNCTAALYLALSKVDVRNREVIIPTLGFGAPVSAIVAAGGKPVFVDSSPSAPLICPDSVKKRLNDRTKVILPIHLYGLSCDVGTLKTITEPWRCDIIEDVAYGLGTESNDRRAGSIGRFGCMSFGSSKSITSGEGGALLCNALDRSELEPCREYGMSRGPEGNHFTHISLNFRITEFQAALLLTQLERVEELFYRLDVLYKRYDECLRSAAIGETVCSPWGRANNSCFIVRLREGSPPASHVQRALAARGIETETALLMHRMMAYRSYVSPEDRFPYAERWADRILRLPLYPTLDEDSLERVVGTLSELVQRG